MAGGHASLVATTRLVREAAAVLDRAVPFRLPDESGHGRLRPFLLDAHLDGGRFALDRPSIDEPSTDSWIIGRPAFGLTRRGVVDVRLNRPFLAESSIVSWPC